MIQPEKPRFGPTLGPFSKNLKIRVSPKNFSFKLLCYCNVIQINLSINFSQNLKSFLDIFWVILAKKTQNKYFSKNNHSGPFKDFMLLQPAEMQKIKKKFTRKYFIKLEKRYFKTPEQSFFKKIRLRHLDDTLSFL